MATKKISALTELTTPAGTEELIVNAGGTSKKVQIDNLPDTDTVYTHPTGAGNEHLPSAVSQTEAGYLDGVTSAIQTQLDAKSATATTVTKTSATGSGVLPAGTTAQRDGSPSAGYLRFNTTDTSAEIYDGSSWAAVGGGNTTDEGLYEMSNTIGTYSITSGNNALSASPITITGSVTIPASSVWTIV